jgi:hypothetical protein
MKAAFIAFILKLKFNDVSNNIYGNKVFFFIESRNLYVINYQNR